MDESAWLPALVVAAEWLIRLTLGARIIMARRPVPVSLAWIAIIAFLPIIGLFVYVLIGENRLAARRRERYERASEGLEQRATMFWRGGSEDWTDECLPFRQIAWLAANVTGIPPLRGNALRLFGEDREATDAMIADIDAATTHCHLLFYIWMVGGAGDRVAGAVIRAAARGVECRVLVDAVGSKPFLRGRMVREMRRAGVRVAAAMPVGPVRVLFNRADLRNHRKILVIDGRIAYSGSQNITDHTFGSGKGVGSWIDAMVRVEGPAAQALEVVFLRDWHVEFDEPTPLENFLPDFPLPSEGSIVHVVPSGPGQAPTAIQCTLLETIHAAREELVMTTPYFVPDEALLAAMTSAALRGVRVTLVLPQRLDSRLTAAASRSHYPDLLAAGVRILEYRPGLLHAKTITVDTDVAVIGTANFDIRSLALNLEVTLFVYDSDFTSLLRFLQTDYIRDSTEILPEHWHARPTWQRAWENTARLLSPLL